MYIEGNIIYFDPFYFKNGSPAKRKYFLVLKKIGNSAILASLPSSVIHLPSFVNISHGCVNLAESCISCYIFEANKPVTKCGWSFDLDTFLYGNWIDQYDLDILRRTYQVEHIDYEIIGQLTVDELSNVIACFKASNIVKRGFKKLL